MLCRQFSVILFYDDLVGLFLAFDENGDDHIDFKEMVCGLSSLCRGPQSENRKCTNKLQECYLVLWKLLFRKDFTVPFIDSLFSDV